MKKRIFHAILAVSLAVVTVSLALLVGVLHSYMQNWVLEELGSRTAYIAHGLEREGMEYLTSEGLPGDSRVTWVAADGQVLFDNWEDSAAMDSHAQRQEIQEAMERGRAHAVRYSDTLAQKTLYYALRLSDGSVLRVSATQDSVWGLMLRALGPVALVLGLTFALGLWLAGRLSRQLVEPINAIDLNAPEDEAAYEELAPLLGKIRSQNRQIQHQLLELQQRQREFAAITEHMSEGLLVVDRETRVLSCNSAALRLLETELESVGESVYMLNRAAGFRRCVEGALAGRRTEQLLEREDSCLQVIASPAEREDQLKGAVVVILDVTERERREQLRREFTANVSHELKTPLTSILGTAEIIENSLVQPGDIPHFAGNIRREAERLISLVNDIIKLSRLDEGEAAGQWDTVDLHRLAAQVLEQVAPAAERKHVALELRGGGALARGVPQILEEMLYNLCDNAVAYNREGGRVTMTVRDTADGAQVTVEDTGVGIPPELYSRIFERFFRGDRSRSSGGTGLGLSIVKHGAAYLGAQVTLDSKPGKGSTFCIQFPRIPE